MNYDVALIIPNSKVCDDARRIMNELGFAYPVYMASQEEASLIGKSIVKRGTKMILSNGITLQHLKKNLTIPVTELAFSGLEAAVAIKNALKHSNKIVHIGTRSLYRYLKQSLEVMEIDPDIVAFHEIAYGQSVEEETEKVIFNGYDVIIGGLVAKTIAEKHGKTGIEITIDDSILKTSITNAHTIALEIKRCEANEKLMNAILQASSESILAVNNHNAIMVANNAAFRLLGNDIIGKDFYTAMKDKSLIDIDSANDTQLEIIENYTPVTIKKSGFVGEADITGQVLTINELTTPHTNFRNRKELHAKGFYALNTFENIAGDSPAMTALKDTARKYALYDSTLLITGDSGTGKELFAQSVHNASRRKAMPFVPVNCAALPESLIESELFGYEKGAFTGADKDGKPGLFELADGGTIFLDEISEIPIPIQSKLLRVIEEGDVIRVGGNKLKVVDVRVICTSNKDLPALIRAGKFKEDLYYRLSVLEIYVPPLRERIDDIDAISASMLNKFCTRYKKNIAAIDPEVLASLKLLPFYGNVRELSNLVERMVIFSEDDIIDTDTMKKALMPAQMEILYGTDPKPSSYAFSTHALAQEPDFSESDNAASSNESVSSTTLEDLQKDIILKTLKQNNGNKSATARALGIDTSTLWRRLKKYNL